MPAAHGLESDECTATAMGIFYVNSSSFQANACCSPRQEFNRLEKLSISKRLFEMTQNRVGLAFLSTAPGPVTITGAHDNPHPLHHG